MKESFKFFIFILLGGLALMTDAFYNGFPIVYSDTSTYIASGLELETPFDRPITYGLFLRLFSLNGLSLWFVVFSQAFILSYLIFLFVKQFVSEESYLKLGLLTVILLSLFTSVSWTVSQVMPDIFTSIALLSMTLILTGTFKTKTLVPLYLLFFVSTAMHMSHVLMFVLLLLIVFALAKYLLPREIYPKRNLHIAILLILTLASVITMGSAISKSKHGFLMGAMVEHGIVENYLNDHCDSREYKLCAYKDSLPERAFEFLWAPESPFYKIGGWKETKKEFNEIIHGSLTEPKYFGMHIKESLKATVHQLVLFSIGDGNGNFLEGTLMHERVSKYFYHDLPAYTSSKQNQSQLYLLNFLNSLFVIVLVLSVFLSIILFVKFWNYLEQRDKAITVMFLLAILINAWSCGTLANAIDRLGSKMIWLVPFITIILLLKVRRNKSKTFDL